jgi:hypothetical protein
MVVRCGMRYYAICAVEEGRRAGACPCACACSRMRL